MTREAVVEGFEYFLDEAIDATMAEFSVSRALRNGSRGPTGLAVDRLLGNAGALQRRVVEPELEAYRQQTLAQFGVVLDYVEADASFETYRDEILEAGALADSIRPDLSSERRRAVESSLLTHHRELGEAVEPLVHSSRRDFWTAAATELERAEAERLVNEHFPFTGPLREHRDAFEMVAGFDAATVLGSVPRFLPAPSFEVEYTDEAIRAMYRAEQSVVRAAERDIQERFD
ncbi:hypothetical protein SAMN05216226_10165 [Halovenus aranensis]|uniref:Uncharacterized protein n=1 Tax=Halovenus aranensis TaxID=890420 RepID=A0A1G8RQX4_9EURY|nr:hypothetical protein [Halovenus aranensis]SDJ19367.1 hypothetical protein SAMN05216226_10165 [Halovenus aranensis]